MERHSHSFSPKLRQWHLDKEWGIKPILMLIRGELGLQKHNRHIICGKSKKSAFWNVFGKRHPKPQVESNFSIQNPKVERQLLQTLTPAKTMR
jgi:hypothetical protein